MITFIGGANARNIALGSDKTEGQKLAGCRGGKIYQRAATMIKTRAARPRMTINLVRAPDVLIKSGALLWEQLETVSLESITQS